jgi:ABC-type dipeptide/oligopeptide/nickel transport system ATPase subunit
MGSDAGTLLEIERATKTYGRGQAQHTALDSISFAVVRGQTVAVIGESGAGKSTLVRLIAGLEKPTSGAIKVLGDAPRLIRGQVSPVQVVFQDPVEALNRHQSVGASIAEPLRGLSARERQGRVSELMVDVGIDPARSRDRPRALSGGQLQRVVIARALAAEPALLLCDEPTSALDVSVQAQIVNLLLDLQERNRFACVLVTHDLGVARIMSDDLVLLRRGRIEENGRNEEFFGGPRSAYGRQLLSDTAQQQTSLPRK